MTRTSEFINVNALGEKRKMRTIHDDFGMIILMILSGFWDDLGMIVGRYWDDCWKILGGLGIIMGRFFV